MSGILVSALVFFGLGSIALGRSMEGYRFDESVRVGEVNLQLNGVGVRAVSIFKGYVAALYVPARTSDPDELLSERGPKRMALRMLLGADAATFSKALTGGLSRNSTSSELERISPQVAIFNDNLLIAKAVKPGDLVEIEYLPGTGTRLALNGKGFGRPVPGDDFYVAFLKIFIGRNVQDPQLKASLLGARHPT